MYRQAFRTTTVVRGLPWLALTLAIIVFGGCEFYGDKQRTWTEDVLLDDGTQLKIKRHVEFTDHNSLARDSYGAYETEAILQFLNGSPADPPPWSVPLIPLVLYRDAQAGEWVLVANTAMCETWEAHGRPMPPYWEFRSNGGLWRAVDLSPSSIGRESNLFYRYHAGLPSRHMTIEEKQRVMANIADRRSKFRRIRGLQEIRQYCGVTPPSTLEGRRD